MSESAARACARRHRRKTAVAASWFDGCAVSAIDGNRGSSGSAEKAITKKSREEKKEESTVSDVD